MSTRRRSTFHPTFRVVSHPLEGQPRHRIPYGDGLVQRQVVEFFSEAEWEALHPAERPPANLTGHLPGLGYVSMSSPNRAEFDEATEEYNGALREHRVLRGIEV